MSPVSGVEESERDFTCPRFTCPMEGFHLSQDVAKVTRQLDTGQIDAGHLDTGQLDTRTFRHWTPGQLDTL